MTFMNLFLLGGVAAFSVPLIIHLLNRSRFRTIEWGAMHLLDSAFQANNRRIRIEQIILLIIRCSIPALLAFCLARPVLTTWQALPGEKPMSVVVLLDNSYSMDVKSTTGTAFEKATDGTSRILNSLKRGSEISVVNIGGSATPVFDSPIYDAHMMTRLLSEREGGFGAVDTPQSLEAALALMSTATHAQREIILVSDFQDANWSSLDDGFVDRVAKELESLSVRPQITLFRTESEEGGNVSIQSLDYSRSALGVGQTLKIRANVRNHEARSHAGLRLALLVDGEQQSMSQVPLGANATAQVLFTYQFKTPGSHVVEVELDHQDVLASDNRIAASITVLERIDVLLVDGAPSNNPLEGETDFLSIALTPFTTGRTKLADLVQVQTVLPDQLDEKILGRSDVVVLANISKLLDPELAKLKNYVVSGGNLLLFPGDKTDVSWHNEKMVAAGLLPMSYGDLQGSIREKTKQSRILAQRFDHPALTIFNDRSNGNLADGEIWIWYRLLREAANSSDATTLARLADGSPFLVEKKVGEGLVLQAATACDAQWSNLPTRPFFLPLIQELVVRMATRIAPPRNIDVGDLLVAVLPSDDEGTALTITNPQGLQVTVRATKRGDKCVVEFPHTQMTGVYSLEGAKQGSIYFVSSTPRIESELKPISDERLAEIAKVWNANVVTSVEERAHFENLRQNGREIWQYVLIGVFCLMAIEIFLQQKFSGRL
jgi:hypothetical protein